MARQVFQLRDGDEQATKYVGISDDAETMRIHVGHFFTNAGREYGTYEKTMLWRGKIEDFSDDLIKELDKGVIFGDLLVPQPPKVSKVVRRKRG